MSANPIEILGARERRRCWSIEEKLRIVTESHEPGSSVRAIAVRYDVYPNLFRTDQAFTTATSDTVYLMDDRVQETIDVVREASCKGKLDKQTHGEFDSACPGYCVAHDTFYVGTLIRFVLDNSNLCIQICAISTWSCCIFCLPR